MNFKSIASVGLVLIAFALAACTRQDATKTTVNIAIPQKMNSNKVGAFAADDTLMHVTINVSGPGLPGPILMNWDACRDCPTDTGSFASLFVDVPTGDNRLFQVLAVYKSSSTKTMSFYYGDAAKSLVTAQDAVAIKVNSVSQGLQVVQGQVSGRLLDTVATGPTDEVEMRYNPGGGKPSLIIDRTYILNGWFSFFMLTGVAFEYRTKSGGLLFGGPVSLDSPQFAVGGDRNRRLKMMIPVHLRQQYGNAGAITYSPDEAMINVWGIWGDASVISDRAVCPTNMFAGFTKTKTYTTGTTYTNLATSNGTALTIADLLNTTTPKTYAYYDGGAAVSVAGGVTTCDGTVMDESSVATGTLYRKHYKVDIAYADGDGKDSAAGFYGPYRRLSNGRGVSSAVVNNATEVSGILLPGLSGMFTQFSLFKRPIPAGANGESYIDSDEIDCRQVAASTGRFVGFAPAGETTPNAIGEFKIVSNISAAEASSGVNGILCPSIAGVMIKQGTFMDRCSLGGCGGGGGGGGGGGMPGLSISLPLNKLSPNLCFLGTLKLSTSYPSAISATLSTLNASWTGTKEFFDDTDTNCTTPIATVSIPANATSKDFRFKYTQSAALANSSGIATAFSIQAATVAPVLNAQFFAQAAIPTTASKLFIQSEMGFLKGQSGSCTELDMYSVDSYGFPNTVASLKILTMTNSGFSVVQDCASQTIVSSSTIASGSYTAKFGVVFPASADATLTAFNGSFTPSSFVLTLNPTALANQIGIARSGGGNIFAGDCTQFNFTSLDSAVPPAATAVAASLPFSIMVPNGSIYSDGSCTTLAIFPYQIANATNSVVYYIKMAPGPGNSTMNKLSVYSPRLTQPSELALTTTGLNSQNLLATYLARGLSLPNNSAITGSIANYFGSLNSTMLNQSSNGFLLQTNSGMPYLDANSRYGTTSSALMGSSGSHTVSLRLKISSTNTPSTYLGIFKSQTTGGLWSAKLNFTATGSTLWINSTQVGSTDSIASNIWVTLTFSYNSSSQLLTCYLNNSPLGSPVNVGSTVLGDASVLYNGTQYAGFTSLGGMMAFDTDLNMATDDRGILNYFSNLVQ